MEIITGTTEFMINAETAVAIGKFDGIHLGHRRLLEEILEKKKEGLISCVFTFDPAPAVLFGRSDDKELTVREEKRRLFERMGIDFLIEFPLNFQTAAMEPEAFVKDILVKQMGMHFLAAGQDLSFGAGGAGDARLLNEMGPEYGFTTKIIQKVCIGDQEISSTLVRNRIEEGNMQEAEEMLGMAYPVFGKVVRGKHLGHTIGFPTVNVVPENKKLLPPKGVYYSGVRIGERFFRGITNIGVKPTVTDEMINGVETYLYDFDEKIYDQEIEIYLYEFKRPEQHFDGLEALKQQLKEDIRAGAEYPFHKKSSVR